MEFTTTTGATTVKIRKYVFLNNIMFNTCLINCIGWFKHIIILIIKSLCFKNYRILFNAV